MNRTAKFAKIASIMTALLMLISLIAACAPSGKISLDKTEHTMYVGQSFVLSATAPEDAEIVWESSDSKVARVRRGTVTATGAGTATITATIDGTEDSATCVVTVRNKTVTISQSTAKINLDESNTLTLTASCVEDPSAPITWSSSDSALATVVNGVVTAYDIGTVTITAQSDAATANCVIEIVEPSRPADQYKITKATNAAVASDPGKWYYHADGALNNDFAFTAEGEPLHRNNTVTATLSILPSGEANKWFYFRYQPKFDLGTGFTATVTVTLSVDGRVTFGTNNANGGTKGQDLKANEPTQIVYNGTVNETNPFYVKIDKGTMPADGSGITIMLSNISFTEKVAPNPNGTYEVTKATNADVIKDPGFWHYHADGSRGSENDYEFSVEPIHKEDGTVTATLTTLPDSTKTETSPDGKWFYFRYQPEFASGTPYTATLTVTLSVDGRVTFGSANAYGGVQGKELNANEPTVITFAGTVNTTSPFYVKIDQGTMPEDGSGITLTLSNITFDGEARDTSHDIPKRQNAVVCQNPGEWGYWADGDFALAAEPTEIDGVLTMDLLHTSGSGHYQFRYQPGFGVGKTFKVTFTATLSAAGTVQCGIGGTHEGTEFEAGQTLEITWTGVIQQAMPFNIELLAADHNLPIKLVVSNIVFTEVTE